MGGLAAAVFVYALPELVHIYLVGRARTRLNRQAVLSLAAIVLILTAVSGLLALVPDDISRGHALLAGLAAQSTIKGIVSAGRDALRPAQAGP